MTWWQYLILANVYLLLFYGFYVLLLRRETFFQLNRFYLVGSAALSFLVPLIQADWARNLFITQQIKQTIYHLDPVVVYQLQPQETNNFTIGEGLAIIYLSGIAFLALRFALQMILLQRSLKNPDPDDAYSFFKSIKLSDKLADRAVIMAHEQVHAQQWHSADVLLIEAIMIINWFNPAVYFYRKAIKHIHEFIADRNAVKNGTSKKEYAMLLLSETFKTPAHQLVNPFFNHSLLKQRILMLQKNNSQRTALLKYGLSAPLFALMLILSSATIKTNQVINIINKKAEQVMMTPAADVTETTPAETNQVTTSANVQKLTNTLTLKPEDIKSEPVIEHAAEPATDNVDSSAIFTAVEQAASFPGGIDAFGAFLGKNIRYPEEARKRNVQGRVIVQFVVEKDGSLTDVRVMRGIGSGCDEEAIRVLNASPKWKPGIQNGKRVRQQYTVPISFTLQRIGDLPNLPSSPDSARVKKIMFFTNTTTYSEPTFGGGAGRAISGYAFSTDTTGGKIIRITVRKHDDNAINITSAPDPFRPIYYVDGVETTNLSSIEPKKIVSISVYRGPDAIKKYGPNGMNGVVSVVTKAN